MISTLLLLAWEFKILTKEKNILCNIRTINLVLIIKTTPYPKAKNILLHALSQNRCNQSRFTTETIAMGTGLACL